MTDYASAAALPPATRGSRIVLHARDLALMLIAPALLLAAWQIGALTAILPSYLTSPAAIAATAGQMIADGELWTNASASLVRCYTGFVFGAGLGVALGLLSGVSSRIRGFFDPLISLSYPVPKIAILPILMAWLGLGDLSKISVIVLSVFFPLYINAQHGALAVKPLHVWAARTFGASRLRIFFYVILPSALPPIFSGLRIGLALSFIMMFAAEMVSANQGLGYLIVQAQLYQRFDVMFVAVATIGFFGFVSDRAIVFIQRRHFAYRRTQTRQGLS
jgi:ABC-type nitrate/sulfonate/bicarbonate transport system permease component